MSEIFITASIMGGLGNQLFQISHALAQGWKYNVDVVFPYNLTLSAPHWETRHYIDNIYRNLNFSDNIPPAVRVQERHWNDPTIDFNLNKPVDFLGYFQSSKHFLGYDDKIRNEFGPTTEFVENIKGIYPDITSPNTLSLHVRRTDYLKISNTLPTIDKSYFDEAIRQYGDYSKLFVFSDDIGWVKGHFQYPNMIPVETLKTHEELWLMSLCHGNIISNSSFSWWGAWLNKWEDKKVFVPSIWFGPAGPQPHNNIFEPDWVKINVKYSKGVLYKD